MYMKILFDNDYLHLYVNVKTNSFPHWVALRSKISRAYESTMYVIII